MKAELKKKGKRILAVALAVLMVNSVVDYSGIAMVSVRAAASTETENGGKLITAFESLPDTVREQTLPIGAKESDINFPTSLTVTIMSGNTKDEKITEGTTTEEEKSEEEKSSDELNEAAKATEETLNNITWKLDVENSDAAAFDSSEQMNGACYTYLPQLPSDYAVAEGATLPEIWVLVGEPQINLLGTGTSYGTQVSTSTDGSISRTLYSSQNDGVGDVLVISGNGIAWQSHSFPNNKENVKKVVFETGITGGGESLLEGFSGLQDVSFPTGFTTIGTSFFRYCTSLVTITLPSGLNAIPTNAFLECSSLNKVVIPDSVTSIDGYAFANCASLTDLEFGTTPGLTNIGDYAFFGCNKFSDMDLFTKCNSLSTVGDMFMKRDSAYSGTIILPQSITVWWAFTNDKDVILYLPDEAEVNTAAMAVYYKLQDTGAVITKITKTNTNIKTLTLPTDLFGKSITSVASAYRNVVSITCTDHSVKDNAGCVICGYSRVGDDSHYEWNSETGTLSILGTGSMYNMYNMNKYAWSNNIDGIQTNLQHLVIGDDITYLGEYCFGIYKNLKDIDISVNSKLTEIGQYAFNTCTSLTDASIVNNPKNLTTLGNYCFGASGLSGLVVLPPTVSSAGSDLFPSFSGVTNALVLIPEAIATSSYLPTNYAGNCLTYTLNEEDKTASLSLGRINYKSGLTGAALVLPEYIREYRIISAPYASFQSIGKPLSHSGEHVMVDGVCQICGYTQKCGENVYYNLEDGVLTLSGSGAMYDYAIISSEGTLPPWNSQKSAITKVIIGKDITTIGKSAFSDCTNIQELVFETGSKLTKIDKGAFMHCSALQDVIVPETVISIMPNAFIGCSSARVFYPENAVYYIHSFDYNNPLAAYKVMNGKKYITEPLKSIIQTNDVSYTGVDVSAELLAGTSLNTTDIIVNSGKTNEEAFGVDIDTTKWVKSMEEETCIAKGTYHVQYVGQFNFEGNERNTTRSVSAEVQIGQGTGTGTVTLEDWGYGNTPGNPVPVSVTNGIENMTYYYKVKSAGDEAYVLYNPQGDNTYPTQIEDYMLKAVFAETENCTEAIAICSFSIIKADIEDSQITITPYSGNYDATDHAAVSVTGAPTGTSITYAESSNGAIPPAGAFSDTCPSVKNVSDTGKTYCVRITGDNYNTWTSTVSDAVSITPITVNYSGITGNGKLYDGTTNAEMNDLNISNLTLSNVLNADKDYVNLSITNPKYAQAKAGETTITFEAALEGDKAANYVLSRSDDTGKVSGSVGATITQATLTASLKASNNTISCELGDTLPALSMSDLNVTGFVNGEDATSAGINSTNLQFAFSPNATTVITADHGSVIISGLSSQNYKFTYTTGNFEITKKKFAAAPYTITGTNNGKTGDNLWYRDTITVTPNTNAGNFKYIRVSVDNGQNWTTWGTDAIISTETGSDSKEVMIQMSTTADYTGALLDSGNSDFSNLAGFSYRLDTTEPDYPDNPTNTYGIKISDNWWRSLLHTITFNQFFKDTQTVTVTANDAGSGIAERYYYAAEVTGTEYTPLTSQELKNVAWQTSCTLDPNKKYVVYAYTVDKAGNQSAYICTDGIIIDDTAPVISGVQTSNLLDVSTDLVITASDAGSGLQTGYILVSPTALPAENQTAAYIKTNKTATGAFTGTTCTLSASSLTANTTYYYYAVAVDQTGNDSVVTSHASGTFKTTVTQPKSVVAPTTNAVSYGTKVSDIVLNGGSAKQSDDATNLPGTWSWSDNAANNTYPSVGTGTYKATFTPDDAEYATVEKDVTITVDAVAPTVTLSDSTANSFTGQPVSIGTANITGADFTGATIPNGTVTYTYYMDSNCSIKTNTAENLGGASEEGAAPVNAGTYYVKASIAADGNYTTAASSPATLTIGRVTPILTMQGSISRGFDNTATVTIPSNTANGYTSSLSTAPTFTYYTDSTCLTKTGTAKNQGGALTEGGAPKNAGTYYVKASYSQTTNYNAVTSATYLTYKITKQQQVITGTTAFTKSYTDNAFSLGASLTTGDGAVSYSITSGTGVVGVSDTGTVTILKKGAATIRVTAASTTNYEAKTFDVNITVNPAELTITAYTVTGKEYDKTNTATVSAVTFSGLKSGESLAVGNDYTVSATFASADAGTQAVSGTVTMKAGSTVGANYHLAANTLTGQSAAIRAVAPAYSIANQNIKLGKGLTDIQKATTATGINGDAVAGTLKWYATENDRDTMGTELTDSYTFMGTAGNTKTLYWSFTPAGSNYKEIKGDAVFTLANKEVPQLTVENISTIYDGTAVQSTKINGTAQVGGSPIDGNWAFADGIPVMKNADTYTATVVFTPTSVDYETATKDITVTISRKTAAIGITLKDNVTVNTTIIAGDALPTPKVIYNGVIAGESLTVSTTPTFIGMPANSNATGTYPITWSNLAAMQTEINHLDAAKNYNITYGETATLTINAKGNSGGSGNGSGSGDDSDSESGSSGSESTTTPAKKPVAVPAVTPAQTTKPKQPAAPSRTPEKSTAGAADLLDGTAGDPFIEGKNGEQGWAAITSEITDTLAKAPADSSEPLAVTVDMNGNTDLPADIISLIAGKNVDLTLDMGDGISWTINGNSVTGEAFSDINLDVTRNADKIPVDIINQVTGENYSMQIELSHNGEFGFTATLNINLEKANAGYYANLFYFNEETEALEFMGTAQIDEDGNAALDFVHASAYTIIVSAEPMSAEDVADAGTSDQEGQTDTETSDTTVEATDATNGSMLALWLILGVVVVIAAGGGIYLVRKKRETEE